MAETLQELFQEYVNYSHEERVEKARAAGGALVETFRGAGWDDQKVINFLVFTTALFANADGRVADEEYKLFVDVTGFEITLQKFKEIVSGFNNEEFVAQMDGIIDSYPDEMRYAICDFGLAFLAADDTLTVEEQKLFVRILQK